MSDDAAKALEEHLAQRLVEHVWDVNGSGERAAVLSGARNGRTTEVYDVDQDIVPGNGAAAVLVRRSDGARFEVFASVSVGRLT